VFNEPEPGAVQLNVAPVVGVAVTLNAAVGAEHVVVIEFTAMLAEGATVFAGTVTLAFAKQPFTVLVIVTE
jgi:hypothetical protein